MITNGCFISPYTYIATEITLHVLSFSKLFKLAIRENAELSDTFQRVAHPETAVAQIQQNEILSHISSITACRTCSKLDACLKDVSDVVKASI